MLRPWVMGALAAVLLVELSLAAVWLSGAGAVRASRRVPTAEEQPSAGSLNPSARVNAGTLIRGETPPETSFSLRGEWPQFRGPARTNVAPEEEHVPGRLPGHLPILWQIEVGEGHAGAAVKNGCVYLVDYDRERSEDAIRCLSLANGAELWRYTYSVKVKRNHGMSRTVPAVTDEYVVALGPKCHVTCLRVGTGEKLWSLDLVRDFGATEPAWYAGQCPLIDGDSALIAPGGECLVMAVDLSTGRIKWKTPNPGGWAMTHASIMPMDYRGRRTYIYAGSRGVAAVSAEDGRIVWTKTDWANKVVTVPSPLVIGPDRLLLTSGYRAEAVMLRLSGPPERPVVEELWRKPPEEFGAEQQTPVYYGGNIYSVMPPGVPNAGELVCIDPDGRRLWASGPGARFGLGPYFVADGKLLALGDMTGDLYVFEAKGAETKELGRVHVIDGHDAWAPMALAGGRLLLRDVDTLMCLDLSSRTER